MYLSLMYLAKYRGSIFNSEVVIEVSQVRDGFPWNLIVGEHVIFIMFTFGC